MRIIYLTIILLSSAGVSFGQNIYNHSVTTLQDSVIHLSSYVGKQLLIVNSSMSPQSIDEYRQLQILQKQIGKNELLIIVAPSDDFDSVPFNNSQLLVLYDSLNLSYIMIKKVAIKEPGQNDLYDWLSHQNKNGVVDTQVSGDFFKFLIDKSGHLKGVYSGKVRPFDSLLLNAL